MLYYVMPYVQGDSLRARLDREGPLAIREAVRILRDVADALAYAHAHGVVHRDVKPDNVMLTGRHALVADFGVARALSYNAGSQQMTTAGVALGTPTYMAPEQAVADPNIDHRVDIYAFGVLAYEVLTGRPPFVGPAVAVMAAHVTPAGRGVCGCATLTTPPRRRSRASTRSTGPSVRPGSAGRSCSAGSSRWTRSPVPGAGD